MFSPGVWVQLAETSYYCYADNCARAVTGTRTAADMPAQSIHRADCSSYMTTTVTPAVVTTTTTTTVTTTSSPYQKRDVVVTAAPAVTPTAQPVQIRAPATIPTYASFCTEVFPGATPHYSSACWSITATTTTLPTSTVTQTATATYTAPIQYGCAGGGKCGSYAVSGSCNNGNLGCLCVTTVEGTFACVRDGYCGTASNPYCAKDADCHPGQVCAAQTCCSSSQGFCMSYTDKGYCPNPSSARAILAKRRAAAYDAPRAGAGIRKESPSPPPPRRHLLLLLHHHQARVHPPCAVAVPVSPQPSRNRPWLLVRRSGWGLWPRRPLHLAPAPCAAAVPCHPPATG
ncbi:uncharacterized protein PG998_010291 [Apiospora kogelbergensis]|uniref:uncharacterized protein n=1 Tax=Apiospora kogelbergensis TaxID=1337665 RepID=UPI00313085F5